MLVYRRQVKWYFASCSRGSGGGDRHAVCKYLETEVAGGLSFLYLVFCTSDLDLTGTSLSSRKMQRLWLIKFLFATSLKLPGMNHRHYFRGCQCQSGNVRNCYPEWNGEDSVQMIVRKLFHSSGTPAVIW